MDVVIERCPAVQMATCSARVLEALEASRRPVNRRPLGPEAAQAVRVGSPSPISVPYLRLARVYDASTR